MSRTCPVAIALTMLIACAVHAQAPEAPEGPEAPPAPHTPEASPTRRGPSGVSPLRGYVSMNGAYQLASGDFASGASTRVHAEEGRFDTTYALPRGPAFDVAGGAVLWGRLAIGAGLSRFSVATPGALTARVPHPFFFNRHRTIGGEVAGLTRTEQAVHVQVRGLFPAGERLLVMVFGGPSFFQVTQGLVADYSYTDGYPYDEASFRSAITGSASVSKTGVNLGADVAFFFTRQLGAGGMIRYAGATVSLPAVGGATEVHAGGANIGGGLRLRF